MQFLPIRLLCSAIDFLHPETGLAAEPQTAFFSYSRDDSEFALRLAEDLKAAGAHVWLDQLDIAPGAPWDRAVEEALTSSPCMLVILSPVSVNSENVRDEISFALRKSKTVIPVLHLDCDIPLRLERHNQIDFRTDYSRGLRTLLKALGVEQPAAAGGGAAVSAMQKDTAADVPDAGERERAAEQQRLEQEEKQGAEQARLRGQERERLATEERARQQKLEAERQAAAEQARLQEELKPSAENAQLGEGERERTAAEGEALPFLTKKMLIGLAVGVVILLLVWMLWPRRSDKQASQPQSAGQHPQSTQQQTAQATGQQLQTTVQQPQQQATVPKTQPQGTGQEPQPPAADVKKPVARKCPEGVYCDPDTNLMWTIKDNGHRITWADADQYCKSLNFAGLSGWELPTIDELKKLYDPQSSSEYKIRKPLRLTSFWVWSLTKEGSSSAWAVFFFSSRMGVGAVDLHGNLSALCVRRSGK